MKLLGTIEFDEDLVNKKYVDEAVSESTEVFVAVYEQTSYADVKSAIDENKVIVLKMTANKNQFCMTYSTYTNGGNALMYAIYKMNNKSTLMTVTLTPSNNWTISHTNLQNELVSGTNIKTINNISLLGSGNINIEGGGGDTLLIIPNVTTYQEIKSAVSSNKVLVMYDENKYTIVEAESDQISFEDDPRDGYYIIQFIYDHQGGSTVKKYAVTNAGWLNNGDSIETFTLPNKTYVDTADTNLQSQLGTLTDLTTDNKDSLVNAINEVYEKSGEPFRVKQWGSNALNVEIPTCTEDIGNTAIPKMVFSIDNVEGVDYQIVGMIAYEVFDAASGGNRINCWPVCQFTGNGQKELSVRWMCGGTTRKTAKRINAWVLLKHR